MRVLEVYDSVPASGISRCVELVSVGLRQRGHCVDHVAIGKVDAVGTRGMGDRFPSKTLAGLSHYVLSLRRVVQSNAVDVVHAHHRYLALAARMATISMKVPIVEHVHSEFLDRRLISFRSDVTVALSPKLAGDLAARYPHLRGRVTVCRNGVHPDENPSDIIALPSGTIVGVGRAEGDKHPRDFAKVVQTLRRWGYDVQGVWLGEGRESAVLSREHSDYMRFPGRVKDVRPWMRGSTVMLSTSTREGVPFAVLDAMALGVPVVARDAGGLGDLLDEKVGLILPKESSVATLAAGVARVMQSEECRLALGRAARARVLSAWSDEQMVECMENILSGAVASCRG
ncbi:MAG: glycosyltransferase family 4 protein [Actinomycetales bacterium]